MTDAVATAGQYWDRYAREHLSPTGDNTNRDEWLAHPEVQRFHTRLRGGLDLASWFIQNYLNSDPRQVDGRLRRGIGLGAGRGSFELDLLRAEAAATFDLYDASATSLEMALTAASGSGLAGRVAVHVADVNELDLAEGSYDIVTFIGSLHHVEQLERVLDTGRRALSPHGVLFASEYIGPNRFAYPEADLSFARRLLAVLGADLRRFEQLPIPDPAEVARVDPTEAIHPAQIVDAVKQRFGQVEVVPIGGALAYMLWPGLNKDLLFEAERGHAFVRLLLELDWALTRAGSLPSYFAYLIARPLPAV